MTTEKGFMSEKRFEMCILLMAESDHPEVTLCG